MDYDRFIHIQQSLIAENEAYAEALVAHQRATRAFVEANNDLAAAFVQWQATALQYHNMVLELFNAATLGAVLIGDGTDIISDTTPTFVGRTDVGVPRPHGASL